MGYGNQTAMARGGGESRKGREQRQESRGISTCDGRRLPLTASDRSRRSHPTPTVQIDAGVCRDERRYQVLSNSAGRLYSLSPVWHTRGMKTPPKPG